MTRAYDFTHRIRERRKQAREASVRFVLSTLILLLFGFNVYLVSSSGGERLRYVGEIKRLLLENTQLKQERDTYRQALEQLDPEAFK